MTSKLNEYDRQLIHTIDNQVGMLLDKFSSDAIILNTLMNFIPDVKCLLNNHHEKLLEMNCLEYKNFAYFAALLEKL